MRRQDIVFEDKDQALRDDVRTLGSLVGSLIREQGGEELFDFVETARIRAPDNLRSSRPPATTASDGAGPPQSPSTSAGRRHTVQEGETLSSISARYYGTPRRFLDIFEANRDTLASPNALRVGQQLTIPSD